MKEYNSNLESVVAQTLLAGVCLVPLLPLGVTVGVNIYSFSLLVLPHIALLFIALYRTVKLVFLDSELKKSYQTTAAIGFAIYIAVIFAQIFLPISSRDALIHHLAVPKWWVEAGSIIEIPWHSWSYYPMLIQTAYTWFELVGLTELTPLYHGIYLLILAGVVSLFLREIGYSAVVSLTAFFFVLAIPVAENLAATPLVDLPLALYSTVAILMASKAIKDPKNLRFWSWCGVAIGLCVVIKPNGFLVAVCLALTVLLQLAAERARFAIWIKGAALATFIAFIIFLPWAVKNYIWTGNPLYPIYGGKLIGEVISVPAKHSFSALQSRMLFYNESLSDILLLPIRIFIEGKEGSPVSFDGMLTPVLLLSFLPLFNRKGRSELKLHYNFSLLFLILALLTGPARVRYYAPLYGSWTILAVSFLAIAPKLIFFSASLVHFVIGLISLYGISQPLNYLISANQSPDAYLSERIPEWDAITFVNNNLDKNAKVYLVMTGNRFYYYDVPVISSGHQSETLLLKEISEASNSIELANLFSARGITHILGHAPRIAEVLQTLLDDNKKQLWNEFASKHLVSLYSAKGFVVWKISQ